MKQVEIKTIANHQIFLSMIIGLALNRVNWIISNNPNFTADISNKKEEEVSELLDKAGIQIRSEFLVQLPIEKQETLIEINRLKTKIKLEEERLINSNKIIVDVTILSELQQKLKEAEEKLAKICSKLIELA